MDTSSPKESAMPTSAEDTRVAMVDYYARRAGEYERIYAKPERQADLRAMEAWISQAFVGRRVLEVACGTGWWTRFGARDCEWWWATDLNPQTLEIARHKPMPPSKVGFAEVDAYTWEGLERKDFTGRFTGAFAGFWWSHVPVERLTGWLSSLHLHLSPGARVVFLDNKYVAGSSTPIARRDELGNTWQQRHLDDGSVHDVLKNFPTPQEAQAALGARALDVRWIDFDHYWILSYTLA
jgi:demethylmenaquinone methyltransferase/2-methoxy-6-polyprenyl-1,4-benzoquinol methylase